MGGSSSVINHKDSLSSAGVKIIDFTNFKAIGRLPRYPEDIEIATSLNHLTEAQYKDSLIIFVSHRWLRSSPESSGWDGIPQPDDINGSKYRLCVEGIEAIKKLYAKGMTGCYLWIDYGCLDQTSNPAAQLKMLDKIVQMSDCVFTPLVDDFDREHWKFPHSTEDFYNQYKSHAWTGGKDAYLSRAWCLMELLYAYHVPLMEDDIFDSRAAKLSGDLLLAKKENRRPHIVYSSYSSLLRIDPVVLPAHSPVFSVADAQLTCEGDRVLLQQLLEDLRPYLKRHDEERYEGERDAQGQRHGRGRAELESGDNYEGDWLADEITGRGKYITAGKRGDIYEGELINGRRQGKGVLMSAEGDVYEGFFVDQKKSGRGKFCTANGDVYVGDFLCDEMQGMGRFVAACGDVYEGEFVRGLMQGRGRFVYSSGDCYEGTWQANAKHGEGTFRSVSGDRYEGEWKQGKMHGVGRYFSASGELLYDGQWREGEPVPAPSSA